MTKHTLKVQFQLLVQDLRGYHLTKQNQQKPISQTSR
jgi:hypothetical protein